MSSMALYPSEVAETSAVNRGRFALVGLSTVAASAVANTLFYYLGDALVTYDPDFVVLSNVVGISIFTIVPAIIAVLLYAALLRYAARPERTFTIISAVVLVLSIIPDYTYILGVEGATIAQATVLALMHVVAAAVIVWMLTTLNRQPQR